MRRVTGRTLRVPTMAERLASSGGQIAYSNVSPGAAYFLDPDHFGMVYSFACWQALGGREDEALETLRRAEGLDPRVREWAANDKDLASVRDRFLEQS